MIAFQSFFTFSTTKTYRTVRNIQKETLRLFSTRPPSNLLTLDQNLASTQPEVIISHLQSRRANEQLIANVTQIADLQSKRKRLIFEGDTARKSRKDVSKMIGMLMKNSPVNNEEIEKKKKEVASFDVIAEQSDEELAIIDQQMDSILTYVPNLLDDR
jgi:seryl-tRNA synthetase